MTNDLVNITELFSQRQARIRGEGGVPEVLVYNHLPSRLRVQFIKIFRDYLGSEAEAESGGVFSAYKLVVDTLCREYGQHHLLDGVVPRSRNYALEIFQFLERETDVERVLDAVELLCRAVDQWARSMDFRSRYRADAESTAGLEELNKRCQQHGVGYRYEAKQIIRIDSELVHSEIVKPALALLHDSRFAGAENEFHLAYEHFRHGRHKEALSECLKSLESTMKSIANSRKWALDEKATAQKLIETMFRQNLIPDFWANHFSGLRATLEGGVPTVRNRMGGHGQGVDVVDVPTHYVAFALHQTAAAIVFLVAAEADLT